MASPTILRTVTATASYVALEAIPATQVSILNGTSGTLVIQHNGDAGTNKEVTIPVGGSVALGVVASSSELSIKSASGTTGVSIAIDYQP
jgi:hypothetical protein